MMNQKRSQNFTRNVRARLKQLEISAHTVAVENDRHPAWLSDKLSKSNFPLDLADEIAMMLNVPLEELIKPVCAVAMWPEPAWAPEARERIATAQQRGAAVRKARAAEA